MSNFLDCSIFSWLLLAQGFVIRGWRPAPGGIPAKEQAMSSFIVRGSRRADEIVGSSARLEIIRGCQGDDRIMAGASGDTLCGGAGHDTLLGFSGPNLLRGGQGDDVLDGGAGNDTLRGGWGNDRFLDCAGANLMFGGAGDDVFENLGNRGSQAGADTISGGSGADQFRLAMSCTQVGAVADTIVDFETGAGGDVIDLNIVFSFRLSGRDLFEAGEVRLLQSGEDALLQVKNSARAFQTVLVLLNTEADDLTAENFHANLGIRTDPDLQPL
jgi:hypothetical protein